MAYLSFSMSQVRSQNCDQIIAIQPPRIVYGLLLLYTSQKNQNSILYTFEKLTARKTSNKFTSVSLH